MKKLLALVLLLGIVGCSNNEIPSHLLIDNGGVFYEAGSKKPFDGTSIENQDGSLFKRTYFSKGQITKAEEFYKSGLIKRILIKNNNEFLATVFDEEGNDISNTLTSFYYPSGLLQETGKYIDGRKDGVWKSFNENGDITSKKYWSVGKELVIRNIDTLYLENNIIYQSLSDKTAQIPFTGVVKIVREKSENIAGVSSFFKVVDGKRADLHEQYLTETGEFIYLSDCTYYGGSGNFYDEGLVYYDAEQLLNECQELWYYDDFPSKLRSKSNLYMSDEGDWIAEYTSFYQSGKIMVETIRIVGKKDNNIQHVDSGIEIKEQKYYEDGSPHTQTTMVNNKLAYKRYNKDGIDISNGEGLGKELNKYPYEDWYKGNDLKQGFYENGLRDGEWISVDGTDMYTYVDGKLNGPFKRYLGKYDIKDGCLWRSGSYVDGLKHGEWFKYITYPKEKCGEVEKVEVFNMGELDSEGTELSKKQLETEILAEELAEESAEEEASGLFTLYVARVYLLNSKDEAEAMVTKLETNGLISFAEISEEDENLHAVYVGPFIDKSDIDDNLARIHKVSGSTKIKILEWEL